MYLSETSFLNRLIWFYLFYVNILIFSSKFLQKSHDVPFLAMASYSRRLVVISFTTNSKVGIKGELVAKFATITVNFLKHSEKICFRSRYNPMHSIPSPLTPGSMASHASMRPVEPLSPLVQHPCPPGFSPNVSPSAPLTQISSAKDASLTSTPTGYVQITQNLTFCNLFGILFFLRKICRV